MSLTRPVRTTACAPCASTGISPLRGAGNRQPRRWWEVRRRKPPSSSFYGDARASHRPRRAPATGRSTLSSGQEPGSPHVAAELPRRSTKKKNGLKIARAWCFGPVAWLRVAWQPDKHSCWQHRFSCEASRHGYLRRGSPTRVLAHLTGHLYPTSSTPGLSARRTRSCSAGAPRPRGSGSPTCSPAPWSAKTLSQNFKHSCAHWVI